MAPVDAVNGQSQLMANSEKTLTFCFKSRLIAAKSLRFITDEAWAQALKHANCEVISRLESQPVELQSRSKKEKAVSTKGMTSYLLSESSMFVTHNTITFKTYGSKNPLAALEPLLDLSVPSWRQREPKSYLKYAAFMRSESLNDAQEKSESHRTWSQEVQLMNQHFAGEATVLGSQEVSMQRLYVANYLPKDEIYDVFSTQVSLQELNASDSMVRPACFNDDVQGNMKPLEAAWKELHGDENRYAANAQLDEKFSDDIGYAANAVFGKSFTTVHANPHTGSPYFAVDTSMPLTRDACGRFVNGAKDMCGAGTVALTEFSLCPRLFTASIAPNLPDYTVVQSTSTVSAGFACAHHVFKLTSSLPTSGSVASPGTSPKSVFSSPPSSPPFHTSQEGTEAAHEELDTFSLPPLEVPVVCVRDVSEAPIAAAKLALGSMQPSLDDHTTALLDTSMLRQRADLWHRLLPRVEPFYAVKCNPEPAIIEALWSIWQQHGTGGFDCASPAEMKVVLPLGVNPEKHIVYANPCKQLSAISFAKDAGVKRLIFDNEAELEKLANTYPCTELVLRVQTDDSLAQCPLSNKFGAAPADCEKLFALAKEKCMNVVGVSFHVGSGCSQLGAFRGALQRARAAFDAAERVGYKLKLLDIGGGFPGWDEEGQATFADHAADISDFLEELFPSRDIQVIAEPGRFFVAASQAILTTVVSVAQSSTGSRYYLNDGLYGSFNCVLYDHASVPRPIIMRNGKVLEENQDELGPCTVFGPTCDGFDVITETMELPRLQAQDKLLFMNMGAYTSAASTSFNGFAPAVPFVYQSEVVDSSR